MQRVVFRREENIEQVIAGYFFLRLIRYVKDFKLVYNYRKRVNSFPVFKKSEKKVEA